MASLKFLVLPIVGAGEQREDGAKVETRAFADRPPGSDCMFSLWDSMISKLMRSSVIDISKIIRHGDLS